LFRRRAGERQALIETARSSQRDVALQQEVQAVAQQIEQTWEQELLARGEAQGKQKWQLEHARDMLRNWLKDRFQTLPEPLLEKIRTASDLDRLDASIRQVPHIKTLDELQL
jgi:hypothetical protein